MDPKDKTISELKTELEAARAAQRRAEDDEKKVVIQLGNASAEREKYKKLYEGVLRSVKQASTKIVRLEKQLAGKYNCEVCDKIVEVEKVTCDKCVAEREANGE